MHYILYNINFVPVPALHALINRSELLRTIHRWHNIMHIPNMFLQWILALSLDTHSSCRLDFILKCYINKTYLRYYITWRKCENSQNLLYPREVIQTTFNVADWCQQNFYYNIIYIYIIIFQSGSILLYTYMCIYIL